MFLVHLFVCFVRVSFCHFSFPHSVVCDSSGIPWTFLLFFFQLECCGFNGPADWQASSYYTDTNTATARGSTVVPRSCCIDINEENCNNAVDPLKVYNTVSKYL